MPFVYLLLIALSSAALSCPPLGQLVDDSTEAYVRLLRLLVNDKKVVPRELAAQIADSDFPTNPLESESGRLNPTQLLIFRGAFADRIREGMDWKRVRGAAREIATAAGVSGEERREARKAMAHLPVLGPIVHDFHRSFGSTPQIMSVQIQSHRNDKGVTFMAEIGRSDADRARAFRIDGGKVRSFTLPTGTRRAPILETKSGVSYAIASTREVTSVVELDHGSPVRPLPLIGEKDFVFVRGDSIGVISGATVTFYPLPKGDPVVKKLPKGDFNHVPSESGDTIFSYGFVEENGKTRLVAMNAETGVRIHDVAMDRPGPGTLETSARLFPDAQGRPILIARTKAKKTVLIDHNGTHELDAREPVLMYSAMLKAPSDRRIWVAETLNPQTRLYSLVAIDPAQPTPRYFTLPPGDKSQRYDVIAGNGHPLSIFQQMPYVRSKKSNLILINDLFDGTQHTLEIDGEKYHLLKGVIVGNDEVLNAVVEWPGGRGAGRAHVQIYGPPPEKP